ncbi:MAG TPA: restriction endonuclease subunit S [Clostridia bacterium]|nr:restriction endonuclease subunit S [Clostridia bacterium]
MEEKRTPAIRFRRFRDQWRQHRVGDIVSDIQRPASIKDEELYQLVTVKRRNEGVVSRGLLKGKDILVKNYFEVREGDYIVSKRQVIHGGNGLVPKNLDKSVVSNEYMVVVSNDAISTRFWTLMSKRREMYKMFFLSSYGVDVEKMVFNVEDWKKRFLIIPATSEQDQINELHDQLDHLIDLHQRKYEKLQNLKSAMLEKMFPKDGADVPEIRFAGFKEPWEQQDTELFFNAVSSNSLSRSDLNYTEGEIKSIHYGDVLINYGAVLDCRKDKIPFITGAKATDFLDQLLQNGDILFADAAEDETVGKATELSGIQDIQIVAGLHTLACRPKHKMKPYFLGYYLNSQSYHRQLLPLMQGTKVLSISRSSIAKTTIKFPVSEKEQEQIGSILYCMDSQIVFQSSAIKKLKNIKEALLKQMFV